VLVTFEDDEWWCHGVEPGGMTEAGATPLDAFANFKQVYCDVLTDLSKGCMAFGDFVPEVRKLFHQDTAEAARWMAACESFRSAEVADDDVRRLPRMQARDSRVSFDVVTFELVESPEVALPEETSQAA